MKNKIILCITLTLATISIQAINLGENLIKNSYIHYLVVLQNHFKDPEATRLTGDELFLRDYLSTASVLDQMTGYTFEEGHWLWIPDSLHNESGNWYWVLRLVENYFQWLYYLFTVLI